MNSNGIPKEEDLERIKRLETIGQFVEGIAHDFNNVLATILIQTDHLMDDIEEIKDQNPLFENLKKGLLLIKKSGKIGSSLARQLLVFSSNKETQPEIIDLNNVLKDMELVLKIFLSDNINLKFKLVKNLKNIKIDPYQIEQVIMNLVINSCDAMSKKGGTLTIETQNTFLNNEMTTYYNVKKGDYAVLIVSDTGHGMDESVKYKIFDPLFSTKKADKGTGLGLAIINNIVKQNHGFIFVESQLNKGTTFNIYLPAVE